MSDLLLNEWFEFAVQMAQYPNDKVRPDIQVYTQEFQANAQQPEPKYEMEPPPPPLKDEPADATYDTSGRKMS